MSRTPDDELADVLGELTDTLRTLEAAVTDARPRRGPFGLPPPPTPRQVLGFTGEYAIPTAIAVLQANIKILELVGAILRTTSPTDSTSRRREAVERLGGETVGHLERALGELQRAVEDGNLPQTPEARDVLQEARRLNDELQEYVRESTRTADAEREGVNRTSRTIPIDEGDDVGETNDPDDETDRGIEIDIEEELRSIKDTVETTERDDEQGAGEDDASSRSADDAGSSSEEDEHGDTDEDPE